MPKPGSGSAPLTEPTLLILMSLASGPKHGYAVMKEVESLSDGRVSLSTGTLYGALARLLDDGWVERARDPSPDGTERRRVCYRLRAPGRRALRDELARLDAIVAAGRSRKLLEGT